MEVITVVKTMSQGVERALTFPLYQAILTRRSRRFPKGATMPGGLTAYTSKHEAQPLTETEEALVAMAGTGLTGVNLSDLPFRDGTDKAWCGNTLAQWQGRTYASPCATHGTELFYTNDDGVYVLSMRDAQPGSEVELAGADVEDKVLAQFRGRRRKLADGRLDIPRDDTTLLPFNQWNVNMPGTTVFMPVTDVTHEFINALFLTFEASGLYLVDDQNGNAEPLREFADKGYLNAAFPAPLSSYEIAMVTQITGIEQGQMCQSMALAVQALGLGGWTFSTGAQGVVMGGMGGGLGFRFAASDQNPLALQPVGLDGIMESWRPPYYPSMEAAVQAVVDAKFAPGGLFDPSSPDKAPLPRQSMDREIPQHPSWCVDAVKTLCQYIWDTHGKFPLLTAPVQMSAWFQAHHLDIDFYDTFYGEWAVPPAVRLHDEHWH